jgi:hypothetical protein
VGILDLEDAFELVVPDGWVAFHESETSFGLAPEDGAGVSVNISVHPRPAERSESASEIVRDFARQVAGVDVPAAAVLVDPTPGQERAFARFDAEFEGDAFSVFAAALTFPGVLVMASANASPGDAEGLRRGEMLVASIAPHPSLGLD